MSDPLAALTLEIVRYVQMPVDAAAQCCRWMIVPTAFQALSLPAMAEWLAAAPRPLVVAPLAAPGEIAVWPVASLDAGARAAVEAQHRQQVEYVGSKLDRLGAAEADDVAFESAAGRLTLTVAAFRAWAASYIVTSCGVTVTRGPADGHGLRVSILRADRTSWWPRRETPA